MKASETLLRFAKVKLYHPWVLPVKSITRLLSQLPEEEEERKYNTELLYCNTERKYKTEDLAEML